MVTAFVPGFARQSPYPYRAKIAGLPVMLGLRDKDGTDFVTTEPDDAVAVAPTDYGFTGQNPLVQRTQPYRAFPKGFGLPVQQTFEDGQYDHCVNVDTTPTEAGGPVVKGPNITTFTPATTDATNGVVRILDHTTNIYAITGRYALVRASDSSWTVSKDFGSGKIALDAITIAPNDGSGKTWMFVAMSGSEKAWTFDGTTWTQMATFTAVTFALVGREFYWFTSPNLSRKCDTNADPTTETNYGIVNQFRLGDQQVPVVRATSTVTGSLLVLKQDSIHSLDDSGEDIEYFREQFKFGANAANGKAYATFGNDVYCCYRGGVMKVALHIAFAIRLIGHWAGPELQNKTTWLTSMRTTALMGHDSLFLLAAVTDETDSYLMKMTEKGIWHGAISVKFASKLITHLFKSTVGALSNHARCYIGFSDGSLGWFDLPNTLNPAADTAMTFSTTDGTLQLPNMIGTFATETKMLSDAVIDSLNFSATNYATVSWRVDPTASTYTALTTTFTTTPVATVAFPTNTVGVQPGFVVTLTNTATTSTPQMTGLGIRHVVRVKPRDIYTFRVLVADHLRSLDGRPYRVGRARIRQVLVAARQAQGTVTLQIPNETSQQVVISRLSETQAIDPYTGKYLNAMEVTAIQQSTGITLGLISRLGPYTIGNLAPFTISFLGQI